MIEALIESPRVLAICEQRESRELLTSCLESAGYRALATRPGEAALLSFAQTPAAIVMFDCSGAEEATIATYRRLRELPNGRAVACVFVTERSDATAERRALELGADDCVGKPLQRSELLLCLRSLIGIEKLDTPDARAAALLRAQRDELLQLQRRREETTALLVHDMKNPLAGVISNAEFLVSAVGLDNEQRECAQDVLQASRRLHRMVLSLLDISHSEHGALLPTLQRLDLNELLRELHGLCWLRLRDKELQLRIDLPPERVFIDADRDMLLRLLANLLDNAMRSAPIASTIELSLRQDRDGIELRVSDAGRHVPAQERAQVFERYVIENGPDQRTRPRRNLGLSACRALTEAHGGRIWLEDRPAQGATVCIRLPRPA